MTLPSLIQSVGNIGIFPSRAFIPAFLTALLLRFGHDLSGFQHSDLVHNVTQNPNWFTSDASLIILGILSVLELAATKSSDLREFLHEFDHYAKAIMAFLTTHGVLTAADVATLNAADPNLATAGANGMVNLGVSAAISGAVFYLSSMRSAVMSTLTHADPHDDLGIQHLIAWGEDLWSAFGLLLIIAFPFLMLLIVALCAGGLFMLQQYLHYREEKSRIPCVKCGVALYPTALTCHNCRTSVAQPREIGFLGTGGAAVSVLSRDSHGFELVSMKRCPVCATRFEMRSPRQACLTCGHLLMSEPATMNSYLTHVDQRLPKTMMVCTGLGLIPIIGIIPGIIYYRMTLVRPFRQYLSFGTGILVKWGVRVLNLMLILLQPVPILGGLLVPIMAYTNYRVYRGVYVQAVASTPPAAPIAVAAPAQPQTQAPIVIRLDTSSPAPQPFAAAATLAATHTDDDAVEQGHS
jgi:hypothetical protein